jgi:hypothetical protein
MKVSGIQCTRDNLAADTTKKEVQPGTFELVDKFTKLVEPGPAVKAHLNRLCLQAKALGPRALRLFQHELMHAYPMYPTGKPSNKVIELIPHGLEWPSLAVHPIHAENLKKAAQVFENVGPQMTMEHRRVFINLLPRLHHIFSFPPEEQHIYRKWSDDASYARALLLLIIYENVDYSLASVKHVSKMDYPDWTPSLQGIPRNQVPLSKERELIAKMGDIKLELDTIRRENASKAAELRELRRMLCEMQDTDSEKDEDDYPWLRPAD